MAKLTKLWTAHFADGTLIRQSKDDRYSKHDDNAEWNPSAFRDILEKGEQPVYFYLDSVAVDLQGGYFSTPTEVFSLETEPLTNRKLIYYREVERDNIDGEWQEDRITRYAVGYEGKNSEGKVEKKVIFIDG